MEVRSLNSRLFTVLSEETQADHITNIVFGSKVVKKTYSSKRLVKLKELRFLQDSDSILYQYFLDEWLGHLSP
jgi:hypothetical protein